MTLDESRFERATGAKVDVTGHTLILPCVSIGSVPQLAIDALLEPSNSTAIFGRPGQLISTLDHRFCVPFVGGLQRGYASSASADERIQGPLRVYSFEEAKVTIVQQRSPIVKSRKEDFVQQLVAWIAQKGFTDVLVLTSLDAGLRTDEQMGQPFWRVGTGDSGKSSVLERMQSILPTLEQPSPTALPALPGGGLAKAYLQAAASCPKTPFSALATFTAEGDNRNDGLAMAALLIDLLGRPSLAQGALAQPTDWALLFGSQTNDSMFN